MATQLHIVILPFPAQGHFSPLVYLATKLATFGAVVTIVNCDIVHRQFVKTWNPPPNLQVRLEQIPLDVDLLKADQSLQERSLSATEIIRNMKSPFEFLLMKKMEPPVSCVLADEFIRWSKKLAKDMNIPSVSYFPGAASWSSVHQHLSLIVSKGDLPLKEPTNLVTYIPGISSIRQKDLPDYLHHAEKRDLEARADSPGQMVDASWVLVNSFYELEPEAFGAMRESLGDKYIPVGPLFSCDNIINTSFRHEDTECLKWLDGKPASSVLYISFGSCSGLSKFEFEELAAGLISSGQVFLLVMPGIFEKTDVSRIFLEQSTGQGIFVTWAPQLKILAHASTGGFLTHCGWNSILESVCNGVPMLGWPRHSDQMLNCEIMVQSKLGTRLLENEVPERGAIEKSVLKFMDHEKTQEMRDRVTHLKNAARKTSAEGGSSSCNIESLITALKSLRLD